MTRNRKIYSYFRYFRWLLSPVILIVVVRMVDVHDLFALLESTRPSLLGIGLILSLLVRLVMVYRWALLLQTHGIQVSKVRLLKIMLTSNTVGVLIPSSLGGDSIRAYALWKHSGNGVESFTSIAVDRFSGLFALSGISFISSLVLFQTLNNLNLVIITGVFFSVCLLLTAGLFFQNDLIGRFCSDRLNSLHRHKLLVRLYSAIQSLLKFGQDKRTLGSVFGLSVLVQLLRILMIYSLALALGIDIPFIYFCIVFPIIMLLVMLPISIGGIGVREATLIYFFVPLGISIDQVLALSLLWYMVVIWWLLIGWIIYAKEGVEGRRGTVADNKSSFVS